MLAGVAVAAAPATSGAQAPDVRLRGLDGADAGFEGGPGRLLAGERVLMAAPRALYGWPATGGRSERLAPLPELGAAQNDPTDGGGFVRVGGFDGGRVVVARGSGSVLSPGPNRSGHGLVVGPPQGPFADPAGCGEASGWPAAIAGDLVAYAAVPAPAPCPAGSAPAVTGDSIVVRDLAAGMALRRVLPLPRGRRFGELRMAGSFLAYELVGPREEDGDPPAELSVVDLRTGAEALRLPRSGTRIWALEPGGTVVTGHIRRFAEGACFAPFEGLRRHAPGDAGGVALPWRACGPWLAISRPGRLVFTRPRSDGRGDVVEGDLATGAERLVATVAGTAVDADARRVLAIDRTCTDEDVRVLPLDGLPAGPAGPRRCRLRVRAPWRLSGRRLSVRVGCPDGCRAELRLEVPGQARGERITHGAEVRMRRGSRRITFRPRSGHARRPSVARLEVSVWNPARRPTRVVRRIRLR